MPLGVFKRGTLERSTSKSQRLKNFKGLRIDLVAAKNRMKAQSGQLADQRHANLFQGDNDTKEEKKTEHDTQQDGEHVQILDVITDSESDYYPSDFEFELAESITETEAKMYELDNYPSDFEEEMEKNILDAERKINELKNKDSNTENISKNYQPELLKPNKIEQLKTNCEYECITKVVHNNQEKLKPDKEDKPETYNDENIFQVLSEQITSSISDDEEAFVNLSLSMDISDNLSENEDVFDRLSMSLDEETEPAKTNDLYKQCNSSVKKPFALNEKEQTAFESEMSKAKLAISFWENELSTMKTMGAPSSKVILDPGSSQQPTTKQTEDINAVTNQFTLENDENTNKTETESSSTPSNSAEDHLELFQRGARQRSTIKRSKHKMKTENVVVAEPTNPVATVTKPTAPPVPRKRESLARKCDSSLPAKAAKNDNDLARKISKSLEKRIRDNPYVDIKTWEDRKKDPGWKLPDKQFLEWF